MESIKFQNQITKFEFVTQGMIQGPKTVDRFLQLHKIYDKNKNKIIKQTSTKIVFDDTEFVLSTNKLPKKTELMKINLIAAIGKFNELGKDNDLCWKISADLKRFKSITTGHFILMGRKTFESFGGRTLPNRIHLVISNTMNESDEKENLFWITKVYQKNKNLFLLSINCQKKHWNGNYKLLFEESFASFKIKNKW